MRKILLIEDDPVVLRIYENRLLAEGFEVKTARDGRMAWELIQKAPPDAILLDLMLPSLSGVEFIHKVRSKIEYQNLPIIVFSITSRTDSIQQAMSAGANKFFAKYNCSPNQVIDAVKGAITASHPASQQPPLAVVTYVAPQAPPRRQTTPGRSTPVWDLSLPSVLIVEDESSFAQLLTTFLETQSFHVSYAGNGADGVRQVLANDFDVVLCDLVMPNLGGDLFYYAVHCIKPQLCKRFVFMTGYQADPHWDRFIREIQGTMLLKPFALDSLLQAIKHVISEHGSPATVRN